MLVACIIERSEELTYLGDLGKGHETSVGDSGNLHVDGVVVVVCLEKGV